MKCLKFIVSFSLLLFLSIPSHAQFDRKDKRIYLLDVTESMGGKGDGKGHDIFDSVKESLKEAIYYLDRQDIEIVIIPFAGKPYKDKAVHGYSNDRVRLYSQIDSIPTMGRTTNITDAWKAGVAELDSTKINYLFLITDGKHNVGSPKSLYQEVSNWRKSWKGDWCFAFYVMLTENAVDKEIRSIADTCPHMWKIESMNVNVGFLYAMDDHSGWGYTNMINRNVLSTDYIDLYFHSSRPGILYNSRWLKVELQKNPYYELTNNGYYVHADGTARIHIKKLKSKDQTPPDYPLELSLTMSDTNTLPLIFVLPEKLNVKFIYRGPRTMNFKLKDKKRRKK